MHLWLLDRHEHENQSTNKKEPKRTPEQIVLIKDDYFADNQLRVYWISIIECDISS